MNFSRNFQKYGVQSCYDFVRLFARTFFAEIKKALLYDRGRTFFSDNSYETKYNA